MMMTRRTVYEEAREGESKDYSWGERWKETDSVTDSVTEATPAQSPTGTSASETVGGRGKPAQQH